MSPPTHPEDKTRHHPDCPREYHDDYIGRPAVSRRTPLLLALLGLLLVGGGAIYALTGMG